MVFTFSSIATSLSLAFLLCYCSFTFTFTEASDKPDPNGNITVKWDVVSWKSDGYYALVTLYNYQKYRDIKAPGWTLGWAWAKKEMIWTIVGAQPTKQGDCSKFKGIIPQSCTKDPKVVDLLPDAPTSRRIVNCCKGGVISSLSKDPSKALSSFLITVGGSGNSKKTVTVPKNFTLVAPGQGYTCGTAKITEPAQFMAWKITCTYSGKPPAKLGN